MNKSTFVLGKDGNVLGRKSTDEQTDVTTVRDRHGNVLGYGDPRRGHTRGADGNVLRRDSDPTFLLK